MSTEHSRTRAAATPPPWGLGDPDRHGCYGTVTVELPASAGRDEIASAIAVVLYRYDPGPVRLAVDAERVCYDVAADTHLDELPEARVDLSEQPPVIGLVCVDGAGEPPAYDAPPWPITLLWGCAEGRVRAWCRYDESYLHAGIAAQFSRHIACAASAIVRRTRASVGDLALMTPDEITETLAAGSTPATAAWPAATIHAAVAASARATPDAVAYHDDATTLTYAQLYESAGAVAGALRQAGVGVSTRVGVCLSRGAELIVVLLGILRAGAAYVPMDTRHPVQRLRFTTQDAGLRLVVTDLADFPEVDGVRAVHPAELRGMGAPPAADEAGPDNPAYVIYTSGSTGRPKGVQVAHRNVMALLAATAADMRLGPDDVWTWFHSSGFDFAVWEIWGALATGARLVGVSYDVSRSPEQFYELLRTQRVTVLNQTPSAFGALQRVDRERRTELALRLVIFGGETLDVSTLRDWFEAHPPSRCRLVNMYGITETTVHVTSHTVTSVDVMTRSRSVGAALPGWSVSVRDERGRPVPFGVAGEIYVGGAGVADGYLNRPDLTAQSFIEDPYGTGRIYRSGDLGRLHPDGRLDHLGRLDNQVQLRGHRVELEEIRAVLLEDPDVRAAAVVVGHAIPGDPDSARIEAYVVTSAAVTGTQLRNRTARLLPDYMVPSTVVVLDSLPLTVNGKVDVARLPRPRSGGGETLATGSGVRQTLRRVWAQLFGQEVFDGDDFFELGGNSLLALRLSAALREAGLPPITVRELYLHPRIDDLDRYFAARMAGAT